MDDIERSCTENKKRWSGEKRAGRKEKDGGRGENENRRELW